jgi:hypothetical protein
MIKVETVLNSVLAVALADFKVKFSAIITAQYEGNQELCVDILKRVDEAVFEVGAGAPSMQVPVSVGVAASMSLLYKENKIVEMVLCAAKAMQEQFRSTEKAKVEVNFQLRLLTLLQVGIEEAVGPSEFLRKQDTKKAKEDLVAEGRWLETLTSSFQPDDLVLCEHVELNDAFGVSDIILRDPKGGVWVIECKFDGTSSCFDALEQIRVKKYGVQLAKAKGQKIVHGIGIAWQKKKTNENPKLRENEFCHCSISLEGDFLEQVGYVKL